MATTKKKSIIFGNWYKGIGTSKYDQAYFDDFKNTDITTEVGTIRCNNAVIKESGTTITEAVLRCICPSGTTYFFSRTTGKIWKRSNAGVYSSITDNTTETSGTLGARFYNGYVYFATKSYLGRFVPDTEGSRVDNYQTFTNKDSSFHPMTVQNLNLYIGDGNYVASVQYDSDSSTYIFNANALDLESQHRITSLKNYGYDLLVFTGISSYISNSGVFRWDTYSSSWSSEDYIDEPYINFVITSDTTDVLFICAGTNGNIYLYDGTRLDFYTQVRNTTTSPNTQLTTAFNRRPMFAIGGEVYSLVVPQRGLATALNHEFTCSAGIGATIHSLCTLGTTILIAWEYSGTFGIDKIDTNKATATFTTPIVSNRKITDIKIPYDSLPTGTSISLEIDTDNAGFVSKTMIKDAADENMYRLDGHLANHRTVRARVTLNPNGSATPIVPHIELI